jgi:CheY-like chemotaxis protein
MEPSKEKYLICDEVLWNEKSATVVIFDIQSKYKPMPEKYVLMLENDSDDRYFTQSALKELNLNIPVRYEYWSPSLLHSINKKDLPGIILLAYNTSPENGLEIVKEFKNHPDYAPVPMVILTEELQPDLVKKYYQAGANTVIKKPTTVELTTKKIKTFFEYWFGVAEL